MKKHFRTAQTHISNAIASLALVQASLELAMGDTTITEQDRRLIMQLRQWVKESDNDARLVERMIDDKLTTFRLQSEGGQ